jgi:hypothetical protein
MKINNTCICWNPETRKIMALEMPVGRLMDRHHLTDDFGASGMHFRVASTRDQVRALLAVVMNLIGTCQVDGADAYSELMKIEEMQAELNICDTQRPEEVAVS